MSISITGGVKIPQGKFSVSTPAPETPAPTATNGTLWSWGRNNAGQVGDGTIINKSSPVQIGALTDWANISAGGSTSSSHAFVINTTGELWGWGTGGAGRLGTGNSTNQSSPVQIGALTDWASSSASNGHSHALKTDGTHWAWGQPFNGRTALNTSSISHSSPVQVGSLTDWAVLSEGNHHGLAVKTDGALWGWGSNEFGQVGDNNSSGINRSSPVQIGALTDWASVCSGKYFSFAIKTNGSLWGWGQNTTGQLGDGTIIDKSSPVQIGALTTWASASAGNIHSMAVKTTGELWAWGSSSDGKLGQGALVDTSSPVQVGALSDWSIVDVGYISSHAIKTNGTMWAWGGNTHGELGLNIATTIDRSSPVQIGAYSDWIDIAIFLYHPLAIRGI